MSRYTPDGLGWSSHFASSFDSPSLEGLTPLRVARAERERYLLLHEQGALQAVLAGRLRHQALTLADLPVVGDWVAARLGGGARAVSNGEEETSSGALQQQAKSTADTAQTQPDVARIEVLLPRRSLLSRGDPSGGGAQHPLAANVDFVLLAAGLDNDFNPRRLERGAALAREAGAEPVVLLTKADLRPDCGRELSRVMAAVPGALALALSSRTGQGLDELQQLLAPGVTAVLLGSSGAGKSTLVNCLLGCERQRTAEVRVSDSRGRHATTARELFLLPEGGLLIDTPGLRAFGLTGGEGVEDLFADVERLADSCRFRDCRHENEPGCGVLKALERGELTQERFNSYLKLRSEAERMERLKAKGPDLEARRRGKEIGKLQRRFKQLSYKY